MFLEASLYVGLYARMHLGVSEKRSCVYLCACVHEYYPRIYSCMLVWLVEISMKVYVHTCVHVCMFECLCVHTCVCLYYRWGTPCMSYIDVCACMYAYVTAVRVGLRACGFVFRASMIMCWSSLSHVLLCHVCVPTSFCVGWRVYVCVCMPVFVCVRVCDTPAEFIRPICNDF